MLMSSDLVMVPYEQLTKLVMGMFESSTRDSSNTCETQAKYARVFPTT